MLCRATPPSPHCTGTKRLRTIGPLLTQPRRRPQICLDSRAKLPGIFNGSAAWGDYNNDGRQDLVLTGDTSSGYIAKVFRNERIGFNDGITFSYGTSFEEETGASLPGVIGNAAWGDYNNDGKQDILLTGDTGSAYVAKLYRNTGNGFTEESNPLLQIKTPTNLLITVHGETPTTMAN
jgi:hypothetical protein